jgi:predicted DNA-binding protein (MmcQ/YjbR family)
MNIEEIRDYCISKKGVTESFPFDEVTLVFKVMNKMFALTNIEGELRVNLKCDPEKAIELREEFDFVIPGFHMNKRLWNTIIVNPALKVSQLKGWIDDSYNLIVENLPKKAQLELSNMN